MMSPVIVPRRKDGGVVMADEWNRLIDYVESLSPLASATIAHKWGPHGVSSHAMPPAPAGHKRTLLELYDLQDNGLGEGKATGKVYAPYGFPLAFITRVTYTYTAGGPSVDHIAVTIGDGTPWIWWVCQKLTRTGAATGTMEIVSVESSADPACPELNGSTDVQYFPLYFVQVYVTGGVATCDQMDIRGSNHFADKGTYGAA